MAEMRRSSSPWIRILVIYTFAGLAETFFYSHMVAFTYSYLPDLGVGEENLAAWLGWFTVASNAIGIPFLPFWGALADRYSRKPMIVRTFLILCFSGLIALTSRNIWAFFFARAFTGFALGNSGIMLTTLSEYAPKNRLGLAFSIMNSAAPIGAFLGPLFGGPIVDAYGLPVLLGIDAAILLLVVLALAFGYHDDFRGQPGEPIVHMAIGALRIVWRSLRLRLLFPALFLLFGGWMLAFTYVSLAVIALYTGPESNAGTAVGIVLGAGGLTTLILAPLLGNLADRFGHWRVLFIGASAALFLWPIPAFVNGLMAFGVAWAVLNGVVSAVFSLSFSVLSSSIRDEVRGRVMSLAYMPVNIGFIIGPAVGTFLIARFDVFTIFPAAALFTAIGLLMLAISRRQML